MQAPQAEPAAAPPLDVRDYLSILRRRKWSISLITIVVVASALAFSYRQTPIYESTAKVQAKLPTSNQYLQNVPLSSILSMDTEQQLVESTRVAAIVAAELGDESSPSALLDQLEVSVPTNTQILEITFADEDPARAADAAQAFARSYIEFKTGQATEVFASIEGALADKITDLQRQLGLAQTAVAEAKPGSPEQIQAQSSVDVLTTRIANYENELSDLSLTALDSGEIIQPAEIPTSPSSPNHVRNGALALVLGLALGVGFGFLRERLDDSIGGREEFEEALAAPMLSVVPRVTGWRKNASPELAALTAPKGAAAEAYRAVRTNLLFMARDGDMKLLLVTSASIGEGKTTTAANLAVSLAQTGKRVIVVGADLRKPRLHRFFDVSNSLGVVDVLAGRASLHDVALRPVGPETLRVISSGPVPHDPAELLGSEQMAALLGELRKAADFVLVDTAPALAVADALILAPLVDGVIVVADATSTRRAAIVDLRDQLDQVGGNVIGGVFNNFDPKRAKYYAPYYSGYGRYRYEDKSRGDDEGGRRRRAPEELWKSEDIWS